MRTPMRWRRDKNSAVSSAATHTLRRGDHTLATVQERADGRWFWYARCDDLGVPLMNTADEPVAELSFAKADAMRYVRDELRWTPGLKGTTP